MKQTFSNYIGYILNRLAVHSFGHGAFLIDDNDDIIDDFLEDESRPPA